MSTHRAMELGDLHADAIQILEAIEKGLAEQPAYARLVIEVLGPERALRATLWLLLDSLKVQALSQRVPLERLVVLMRDQLEGPPW